MKNYHISKSYIKEVTLAVNNLDESEQFYNDVIQLDTISKEDGLIVLGNKKVPLIRLVQSNGVHSHQEGLYHIAFLLKDETQLANWLLLNQNYERFIGASHHGVSKAIYLEDPEGNGIEVYADVDDSKWERNGDEIKMVTMHLNLNELLKKATNSANFDIVIGHLHLQTKRVDGLMDFYKNLGFNITFDLKSAVFMSFNEYHHHIAFNQWNNRTMSSHNRENTDIQGYEIWYESKQEFDQVLNNLDQNKTDFQQIEDYVIITDPLNLKIKLSY